jgi:hypothetical protein
VDKCCGDDDTRTEIFGEPVPNCERWKRHQAGKAYSNRVRGTRATDERQARIGKAALNVPVTQMAKMGAMRRSVQLATFPLVSQLKKDMLEDEAGEHGERTGNRPADRLGYVGR